MNAIWKITYTAMIVGLLALAGCAAPPTPAPLPTGGLAGIISDASSGAPVAGAQVTVAGQVGVFTVMTGDDGAYDVGDLTAGAYLVSVQATGYYVSAVQVGVVADVVSSGNVVLEPETVAVVTATPTRTPASTPAPTPTARPSVTPAPTETPTPSPTPARRASTAARPATRHPAPVLQEPRDGSSFSGPHRITFRWQGTCCLAADEYYVVSIPHPLGVEEGWVKTSEWTSPDYLYLLVPESHEMTWNVSVRRHTGEYSNGQWKGPIVSPLSATWRFRWYTKDGPSSPLPRPSSPLPTPGP